MWQHFAALADGVVGSIPTLSWSGCLCFIDAYIHVLVHALMAFAVNGP